MEKSKWMLSPVYGNQTRIQIERTLLSFVLPKIQTGTFDLCQTISGKKYVYVHELLIYIKTKHKLVKCTYIYRLMPFVSLCLLIKKDENCTSTICIVLFQR